MSLETL